MGEAELRRRIRTLEEQLRRLSREQEAQRRRIESQCRNQIRELEYQLRNIEVANTEQIRLLRENMTAAMQQEVAEIRAADRALQLERERMLQELRDVSEALRQELEEIQSQEQARAGRGRETAESLIAEAEAEASAVDVEPHAFFCPGRYAVLLEHLDTARSMLDAAYYESAAAMADAAACELAILGIDVRERQREWESIYDLYRMLATGLQETVAQFEQEAIATPCGSFRLTGEERDYWSGGVYQGIRDRVEAYCALIRGIEAAGGVTAYLNANAPVKGFHLSRQITELHRLAEELTAVISCIRNERLYSDQRYLFAAKAEEALAEKGYQGVSAGFRGGEPLDSFELVVSVNQIDFLNLILVPLRQDGIAVRNVAIVTLDVQTIPNPKTIQRNAEGVLRLLKAALPELKAVWFNERDGRRPAEERKYKAQPDVKKLATRLARKYQ